MGKRAGQYIDFDGTEPTFFAMIPKMAIMELNPYELALYCNLKQTAAENGKCFKSNETLAKETQMSVTKVKAVRKSLEEKGYITVHRHVDEKTGRDYAPPTVLIVNVWRENHKHYTEGGSHHAPTRSHDVTTPVSPHAYGVVTTSPLRITNEEKPDKKKRVASGSKSKTTTSRYMEKALQHEPMIIWLVKQFRPEYDLEFTGVRGMYKAMVEQYTDACVAITGAGLKVDDLPGLYTYLQGKAWPSFGVNKMAEYAVDYAGHKANQNGAKKPEQDEKAELHSALMLGGGAVA